MFVELIFNRSQPGSQPADRAKSWGWNETIQTCLALMNGNGFQWNFSITLSVSFIRNFFVNLWCFISSPAQFDRRDNFSRSRQFLPSVLPCEDWGLKSLRISFFRANLTLSFKAGLHWMTELILFSDNLSFYFILMQNSRATEFYLGIFQTLLNNVGE